MGYAFRNIGRHRLCRRRAGLTQAEMASQAGPTAGCLGLVENTSKVLPVEPLLPIAAPAWGSSRWSAGKDSAYFVPVPIAVMQNSGGNVCAENS